MPRSATVRTSRVVEALTWRSGDLTDFMARSSNAEAKSAIEKCFAQDLATKLSKAMSALESGSPLKEEGAKVPAGDYGHAVKGEGTKAMTATPPSGITLGVWTFAREYR
ncbi:unnamed protein product, partial [Choristocarpus tenellus]